MKPIAFVFPAAGLMTAFALAGHAPLRAASAPPLSRTPVVVELFTSEGCSDCPPADALLSRLTQAQPIAGADVIALEEHVDYWNSSRWADPFSAHLFNARQGDYSTAFHLDSVYTPQMIVDGKTQFVGSDSGQAAAAIAQASRQPMADVSLTQTAARTLSVRVSHLPASAAGDPAEVLLAITEDGLRSDVGGGENSGRHLVHNAVVRRFVPLGLIHGGAFTASPILPLDAAWRRGNLHAVVFVQERASRRIIGATEIGWR